ncbi:MAG: hypothetical protein Q7J80_08425 [Anaerolineales bacterium]|nr:hypothetical protein [Anaerolineales bacterium]
MTTSEKIAGAALDMIAQQHEVALGEKDRAAILGGIRSRRLTRTWCPDWNNLIAQASVSSR